MWVKILMISIIIIETVFLFIQNTIKDGLSLLLKTLYLLSHILIIFGFLFSLFLYNNLLVGTIIFLYFLINFSITIIIFLKGKTKVYTLEIISNTVILVIALIGLYLEWKYILLLYYFNFLIAFFIPRDDLFPNKTKV